MAKDYIKQARGFWLLDEYEPAACTMTGQPTNEWHHLRGRGMGGSKYRDSPINTAPVIRKVHDQAERDPEYNRQVTEKHIKNLIAHICEFHNYEMNYTLTDVLQKGKN